jgi:hypothetical protein
LFTAEPGDVVVFRQSGKPASHAAILGAAHYLDLSKTSIGQVRARWADRIGADDDGFWRARADARWVSLLTLYKVCGLPPQQLAKRDRQGWVTYPSPPGHASRAWTCPTRGSGATPR